MENRMLVSTAWLAEHLHDPAVRIVDIRGHVFSANSPEDDFRGHYESYVESHIPNAVFVDWVKHICDDRNHLRIAEPQAFAEAMQRSGIGPDTLVIVYDNEGGSLAARLWWALNYYGHTQVALLDGGWRKWQREERPVTEDMPLIEPGAFKPEINRSLRQHGDDIVHLLNSTVRIVDCRLEDEYRGESSFARQSGHIPGAVNIPAARFTHEDGTFLGLEALRGLFRDASIDGSEPQVIFYSNVGVDACVGLFALALIGLENGCLYDEGWQEWGNDLRKPVDTGAAAGLAAVG